MRASFAHCILAFLVPVTALTGVTTYAQGGQSHKAFFVFGFKHAPETVVFKLTDPQKIQQARDVLANGSDKIISGTIIKQPAYYNSPWSFHLDPQSIVFVESALELCDSNVRQLEDNRDTAFPGWCPWSSRLLREIPPPVKPGTGNLVPAVSMTNPYADNTFTDGALAQVTLLANAADADGGITKVEFSSGGRIIGEAATYPYSLVWRNLTAGSYTVSATATDNSGAKTSSRSVTFLINPGSPHLVVDANTGRGIVLDSVMLMSEPFPVVAQHFFSTDRRTRVTIFGHNLELNPGETLSSITLQAEDSQQKTYVLPVEAASQVPDFPWLWQITVKLPDELQGLEDVRLGVLLRGNSSNKVLVKIR